MKALVFVFSRVEVPYDPKNPLRRYDPTQERSFLDSEIVSAPTTATTVWLDPGIYAVFADDAGGDVDSVRPPIRTTGDTVPHDATHVVIEYAGKDGWPRPPTVAVMSRHGITVSPENFRMLVAEVHQRMFDRGVQKFIEALSVGALSQAAS